MTHLYDLERYSGFTFGDNSWNQSNAFQKRLAKKRVPINSTIRQRGMGLFKKRVQDAMQEDNAKDVNKKYTYTTWTDAGDGFSLRFTQNLRRGDNPVDQFIGMGIQPIYFKLQYFCKMDWQDENPNKAIRILATQWLNNSDAIAVTNFLLDDSAIDVNAEKYLCSHKNPANIDSFEVLADHVKLAKPVRGTGFGAANPVTSLYCVGEIYISGKQMQPILLSQDLNATLSALQPIKNQCVLNIVTENNAVVDDDVFTAIGEFCYTDKL